MSWDGVERRKHARYVIRRDDIYSVIRRDDICNGRIIDIRASVKFVPYKTRTGSDDEGRGEKAVAVLRQRMI